MKLRHKLEDKTKARCQLGNEAIKIKLTNLLRGKERRKGKKKQICKVKQRQIKKIYMLKINCKRKRTVGKANKGINVEKMIIGLKSKIKKREGEKKKGKLPRTAKAQHRCRGL